MLLVICYQLKVQIINKGFGGGQLFQLNHTHFYSIILINNVILFFIRCYGDI